MNARSENIPTGTACGYQALGRCCEDRKKLTTTPDNQATIKQPAPVAEPKAIKKAPAPTEPIKQSTLKAWEMTPAQYRAANMGSHNDAEALTEKPTAPEATGESLNLDQVRKLAKTEKVFVRWSAGPKYDLQMTGSKDKVSGSIHAGLSAVAIDPEWSNGVLASRLKNTAFFASTMKKLRHILYWRNCR